MPKADRPPRPGQALILAEIAEEHGWQTHDHWHHGPGPRPKLTFVLLLSHPDPKQRLKYGVLWQRRQPTFDFGWWSRGDVQQGPKRGRLSERAIQRIQTVISANSATTPDS